MINKIEFSAKNLTSNAGLFLLLEHANKNGIFDLIDHDLVFDNASTNKNKMERQILCEMEVIMLNLSELRHNHHPFGVKILANFIQRGFSEIDNYKPFFRPGGKN